MWEIISTTLLTVDNHMEYNVDSEQVLLAIDDFGMLMLESLIT